MKASIKTINDRIMTVEQIEDIIADVMAVPAESTGVASLQSFIIEKLSALIEPEVSECECETDPDFTGSHYDYYGVQPSNFY